MTGQLVWFAGQSSHGLQYPASCLKASMFRSQDGCVNSIVSVGSNLLDLRTK